MKRYILLLLISSLLVACNTNVESTMTEAEKIINELEADKEVSDELYMDAKQVFETLELAHNEQRELTVEEKQLVNEFDTKYNRDSVELTHAEKMIVLQLLLMSKETTDYESERENLLEYVEFE